MGVNIIYPPTDPYDFITETATSITIGSVTHAITETFDISNGILTLNASPINFDGDTHFNSDVYLQYNNVHPVYFNDSFAEGYIIMDEEATGFHISSGGTPLNLTTEGIADIILGTSGSVNIADGDGSNPIPGITGTQGIGQRCVVKKGIVTGFV